MATQSPFSFLERALQSLARVQPPAWAVQETQRRVVLLLNHVLMQEPQAMERLLRQKGQVVRMQWRHFSLCLQPTAAGLLDLAPAQATPSLTLEVSEPSALELAQTLLQGGKPPVQIAGDVQLAAELNWLADNVRWDVEEDLSRILGDAPAHLLMQGARSMVQAARAFAGKRSSSPRAA